MVNRSDEVRVTVFPEGVLAWNAFDAVHHSVEEMVHREWGWKYPTTFYPMYMIVPVGDIRE